MQSNQSLTPYTCPPKPTAPSNQFLIQQELDRTKSQLQKLENMHRENQKSLTNRLEQLNRTQVSIIDYFGDQQEFGSDCVGFVNGAAEFSTGIKDVEEVYQRQLQKSAQVQHYIQQTKSTTESFLHALYNLTKQKQPTRPTLPEVGILHSQVLQQIEKCQQKFNRLIKKNQHKLEEQLKQVREDQSRMLRELEKLIDTRIAAMEAEIGNGGVAGNRGR